MGDIDEGKRWKDAGDALYKTGDFHRAACCYDNALLVLTPNAPEMAACFKNRAACHLKLKQFRNVIDDCTRALAILPNDEKSLFRRCQAFVALNWPREALTDAMNLARAHPSNHTIRPIINHLLLTIVKTQNRAADESKTLKYVVASVVAAGIVLVAFGLLKAFR